MANSADLDCEDFIKALEKLEPRLKTKRNALIDLYGEKLKSRVADRTRVMKRNWDKRTKGELKGSWKAQRVREYRDGGVAVARVISESNIAHLINDGHYVYTAPHKYAGESKGKKIARRTKQQIAESKIERHGFKEGDKMLERSLKELQPELSRETESMLDSVIKEVGLE